VADQSSERWPAQYPAPKLQYRVATQFNPAIRAANADRERTVEVLKAGFTEGRLTQDEYNDRMGRAYEARTYGELAALTADLPVGEILPAPPLAPNAWAPPAWVPPGPPASQAGKANPTAIASLILGLLVPLFAVTAIPAVICGHRARADIKRTGEHGASMAAVGLVLGYLGIIATVLFVISAVR
jgi:hypothetical protein